MAVEPLGTIRKTAFKYRKKMFLSYKVKNSECEMACIIVTDIWKQELKMKEQRTRNYINYFLFPFISFKFCLLFVKFLKSFPAPPKEDSAITLKEFVCGVFMCAVTGTRQLKRQEQKEAWGLEIADMQGNPNLQR